MLDTLLSSAAHSARTNRFTGARLNVATTHVFGQMGCLSVMLMDITAKTIVDLVHYLNVRTSLSGKTRLRSNIQVQTFT